MTSSYAAVTMASWHRLPEPAGGAPEPSPSKWLTGDPLHARARDELGSFLAWLRRHGVAGYIGEVGWPGRPRHEAERWNALADAWFGTADAAGLWVTAWATGEWWPADYRLAVYGRRGGGPGVDSRGAQADIVEKHLNGGVGRGINVAGGEFGAPVKHPAGAFSSASPGIYERDYHFDSYETFAYLASRGIGLVRIPFRWERLQPELRGDLHSAELRRLRDVAARARAAGTRIVLDMHNYGAFYLPREGGGVRCPVGSEHCSIDDFADVWGRLSSAFGDDDAVVAYGLMNEPVGLVAGSEASGAAVWQRASQQATTAIRRRGDDKLIMVSGYFWAGVRHWLSFNGEPWIEDPANRFMYEAHHYFDRDASGRYGLNYEQEVERAQGQAR